MGKKDKKKCGRGAEKTASKTTKKLKAKLTKASGEAPIENMIKAIEEEQKQRKSVKEVILDKGERPTARAYFSMTTNSDSSELVLFGGELYNGRTTALFNELLFYNCKRGVWSSIQSPGAPPPRSSHQAVFSAQGGGQLWIFGGEYASPSESQFYHYKDLWVFHFTSKRWEKVCSSGPPGSLSGEVVGPSARSGHRMVLVKKSLLVFGGFHDVLFGEAKYFNDVHLFDTTARKWKALSISGKPPSPRSACCMFTLADGRILVYGGFCKEKVNIPKSNKTREQGRVLQDMFLLVPDKNDDTSTKWRWQQVKQSGCKPQPARAKMVLAPLPNSNKAVLFGGVCDKDDVDDDEGSDLDDEDDGSQFYNDLYQLHIDGDRALWTKVALDGHGLEAPTPDEHISLESLNVQASETRTVNDGVFTVSSTVSVSSQPPPTAVDAPKSESGARKPKAVSGPSPRYGSGVAVSQGMLYLYGGVFEDKDGRQITFDDLYCIDVKKWDEWRVIQWPDWKATEWLDSSSSSSDDMSDSSEDVDEDGMDAD